MNLKSLITAWDEDRAHTVGGIVEFLKQQGFKEDKIISAFKKSGFNIHLHSSKEDKPDVSQEQNPENKDDWVGTGLEDSNKEFDNFDTILSSLTPKDIPIGTQIDRLGKIFTWKGASWVCGGTLAKKEIGAALTQDALVQIAKKKQNEPKIESTVPGLKIGMIIQGPDNKLYQWKGASWVCGSKLAKKEIGVELTKQALAQNNADEPQDSSEETIEDDIEQVQHEPSQKVKELHKLISGNIKNPAKAATLLQSNHPLAHLALAILSSPHYQEIINSLEKR